MRIAQVSTLSTPVRKEGAESVEGLVYLLTRELVRLGHEVTVFASAGSETAGRLVATLPGPYGDCGTPHDWQICEWMNLCRAIEQSSEFDVLHSHSYLWGLPLTRLSRCPMIHTLHIMPYEDEARLWSLLPDATISAVSAYQWSAFPELTPAATVYHGVDEKEFVFQREAGDYVLFLGRLIAPKGPLSAIALSQTLGIPLVLAGRPNDYYEEHIRPLVRGRLIRFAGYVTGEERRRLLGAARALLYPIQEPEPFGLVLIESMLCGTPVAALNLGAVSEIVDQGVTGFYADTEDELAALIPHVLQLDRAQVRRRAEERFSAKRMTCEYAELYSKVVSGV